MWLHSRRLLLFVVLALAACAAARRYACPMHPLIEGSEPGQCPKCGMALQPVEPRESAGPSGAGHHSH